MAAKKTVRYVKRITRQSGMAGLITGTNGSNAPGKLKRGIHTANRKKLAAHIKYFKYSYFPKSYERYKRDK